MNQRQLLVQKQFLNNEKAVIKRLNQVYNQSLKDINENIKNLEFKIGDLKQQYDWLEPDDPEMEKIKSMIQSKVYQKKYQESIQAQVEGVLDKMKESQFVTVSGYLDECYNDGFIGTMYDLHGQEVPLFMPIDQESMVRAVQLDSKISKGLYTRLGEDVDILKKKITAQVSRAIATNMTFAQTARQLAGYTRIGYNNSIRVVRTEGHRIQCTAAMDACYSAKEKGADIVKQWDAALDSRTRESHAKVDGEIRELDKKFSNGLMFPGDPSGPAEEVVNCRCALLQRARWALDEEELETLKERAAYFGLDKSGEFEDFKKNYLKAVESESGIEYRENERITKHIRYAVDTKILDGREFVNKFDTMSTDAEERREFLHNAKEILKHRSGQNGEDLYLYNSKTRKWYKSISGTKAGTPEYTDEILAGIAGAKKGELIAFHNHPASMPPSADDINTALQNGYEKGYALCHNGKIYMYTPSKIYIDETIYDLRVAKYEKEGYNMFDSQIEALKYLSGVYGFTFEEVI